MPGVLNSNPLTEVSSHLAIGVERNDVAADSAPGSLDPSCKRGCIVSMQGSPRRTSSSIESVPTKDKLKDTARPTPNATATPSPA
ncbi:hypothetical protein ACLB2K_051074 [Fragaria x ananassa]